MPSPCQDTGDSPPACFPPHQLSWLTITGAVHYLLLETCWPPKATQPRSATSTQSSSFPTSSCSGFTLECPCALGTGRGAAVWGAARAQGYSFYYPGTPRHTRQTDGRGRSQHHRLRTQKSTRSHLVLNADEARPSPCTPAHTDGRKR